MAPFWRRDRTTKSRWTVDSGVLLFDGEPRMELHTVTRAHCTFSVKFGSYGIVLRSNDNSVSVSFGTDVKAFSRTGSKILLALHRSAPQVRVHMRGGRVEVAMSFLFGLACSALALYLPVVKLISEQSNFGWEALPFVLFFAAIGATFVWLYHPWNSGRFYTTPQNAANAIKHGGWRAFYGRYG